MRISIIGCGLIGKERIEAVNYISNNINPNIKIDSVFDTNENINCEIKNKYNLRVSESLDECLNNNPDWVFVSVPHNVAPEIIKKSFNCGANVLAEKPLGMSLDQCTNIINYKPKNLNLNVGFNYRFYDGIANAIKDCRDGKFGKIISVNIVLAHGNSPNMSGSWKLDPIKDGGVGIDLGCHVLDLCLQISGKNLKVEKSKMWTGFWGTGLKDEEMHSILSDDNGTIYNIQVSLNRWRSTFRFEINGDKGYCVVEGRGRSYGQQTYTTGERWGWSKYNKNQKDTEIIKSCDTSKSFIDETIAVLKLKDSKIIPCDDLQVTEVMRLLELCRKD